MSSTRPITATHRGKTFHAKSEWGTKYKILPYVLSTLNGSNECGGCDSSHIQNLPKMEDLFLHIYTTLDVGLRVGVLFYINNAPS